MVCEKIPPHLNGGILILFGVVNVIEDVLLAEAVVAGAAGAVAEGQIGVVRVRTSADLALSVL